MRRTQRSSTTPRRRRSRDRGSALLVTLVVIAGLSLLGLAFVGVSETESAISVNQRNAMQMQAMAEAGARAVVEWFQDPLWARAQGIMPSNNPAPANMKRTRTIAGYAGEYKPLTTQVLFDKPYRPLPQHRFYGDDATADITIDHNIDNTTMVNLNTYLFGADSRTNGRISEIKVYAPPMVGGARNAQGFWEGGERFGTATIKVTAEKWTRPAGGTLVSRQVVRIVVGEFPMPIPSGPIQSASNAAFGGSFDVHWGDEVALGNLDPSVTRTRIPWQNPFERPHFERGYDPELFPLLGTAPDNADFFSELVGKSFQDPWAGSRARGTNADCGTCGAYTNTSVEGEPVHAAYQNQTQTIFPTTRAVVFPTIRYDTWKRIAVQGRGTKGIYYFEYVAGSNPPTFKRNGQGTAYGPHYWVNTRNGARLGAGFYFFDTKDGTNPQNLDGTTNVAALTPGFSWQSAEFNSDFQMAGFIYFNVAEYRSTGGGTTAPVRPYNMPGEIFRDVGRGNWLGADWERSDGQIVLHGAGDGEFSYHDLNNNGRFDVVVRGPVNVTSNDPGANTTNQLVPKTWSVNPYPEGPCSVPPAAGPPAATSCSEPHEPYLNFIYPANRNDPVTVGWQAFNAQTRRPRDLNGTALPNCGTNPERCTSNGYDRDGALVDIPASLNGVLYNEGDYRSTGQVDYFGSVLMRGTADGGGNAEVWFDEKLVKDNWAPPGMPRVIVYNSMTDDQ